MVCICNLSGRRSVRTAESDFHGTPGENTRSRTTTSSVIRCCCCCFPCCVCFAGPVVRIGGCLFLSFARVFFLLPRSSIPRLPDAVCSVWGGLNAHEYRATRMRPLASGGFSAPALLLIRSGSVLCRQAARMSNDKTLML